MLSSYLAPVEDRSVIKNQLRVTHLIRRGAQETPSGEKNVAAEYFEVYKVFKSSALFSLVNVELLPSRQLFVADKLRLQLQLVQDYAKHFALLNGLFGFGKTQGVLIDIQKETRSVVATISIRNDQEAATYFNNVIHLFERELAFKKSLRVVVEAERQLKEEFRRLYSAQFSQS
ncbi:MAG TPA: hypothetical protein VD884_18380 [Ohtaekwangia sp.]|nr:hypothetical protein [Ohtaekwangia sp.]